MPFSKCFYHLIWTTSGREPLISEAVERLIFGVVKNKAAESRIEIFAINGTVDHIHVAAKIPPSIAVSDWVGKIKGASSYAVNGALSGQGIHFQWQESFGVLTFGEKTLAMVVDYIAHQKQHHANNHLIRYMERDHE